MTVIVKARIMTVIIEFSPRNNCKQVLQVKKDLKDLTTDNLDLPRGTEIFLNQIYAHIIVFYGLKVKRLHSMGIINSFYISGVTVNVKITENSRPLAVTHLNVFQFISPMLICYHHQHHHSCYTLRSYQVYLTVEFFFFFFFYS